MSLLDTSYPKSPQDRSCVPSGNVILEYILELYWTAILIQFEYPHLNGMSYILLARVLASIVGEYMFPHIT